MKLIVIAVMALMNGVLTVRGQTAESASPKASLVIEPAAFARDELVREIDDPSTGARWLLLRDDANPVGPGRLVLIAGLEKGFFTGLPPETLEPDRAARPLIQKGDALIVEEHSPIVDARLEAVALSSAIVGGEFQARLKIGGKLVRVVAMAAGRGALAPDGKAER
jgi:hypothetical protein